MTIFRVPRLPSDTPSALANVLSNAFKQLYADLKAATARPGTVAIQTASYSPMVGETVRVQPPSGGMAFVLPMPNADNRGLEVTAILENPQGDLRVTVASGSNPQGVTPTVDGSSLATFSTAGTVRFVSNGVDKWSVPPSGSSAAVLAGNGLSASGSALNVNVGASLVISSDTVVRAALTGDVTASQNSNATTIATGAVTTAKIADANVTNAKLANVASDTFKGNVSGSSGAPSDVSLSSLAGTGLTFGSHQLSITPGGAFNLPRLDASTTPLYLFDFNGRISDLSGNGRNLSSGSPQYAPIWANQLGLLSSIVSRPSHDAAGLISGDITIEGVCVIPPGVSVSTFRIATYSDAAGTDETSANNFQYSLGISYTAASGATTLNWLSEHSAGVNDSYSVSSGSSLQQIPLPGIPFYIAATRISNVIQFYLNGVAWGAASSALTTPDGGSTAVLVVGLNQTSGNIVGQHSLRITSGGLSAATIKAAYNATVGQLFGQI